LSLFFETTQRRWNIEIFCKFTTFLPFTLLNETTMSYFFRNGIQLLMFGNLHTAPPRLSIKLSTVAIFRNTVQ